jgi:serine/threonine-protein kinase HipA
MNRQTKLDVFYHDRHVGTMALYQKRLAAFEYDREWLADGFSVSPFSLPLEKKVFMPKLDPLGGSSGCLQTAFRMAGDACWLTV